MSTETTTAKRIVCPSCRNKGKRVGVVTLRALLKPDLAAPLAGVQPIEAYPSSGECRIPSEDTGWRFCDSNGCDVVYFSEATDEQFTLPDLTVDVGIKQQTGERPLCYCFGHSVASIQAELRDKGRSDSIEDIRAKMKEPGCHCATANPSGACCLGSVSRGIEIARAEHESDGPGPLAPVAPTNRGDRIAKVGTLISAVMASSCCWLPLVLLAVGVSGAGIAATLETYRPMFIVVTFGFLAAAFYFTYRPRKVASAGDCCTSESLDTSCCDVSARSKSSLGAMNKVVLWLVTAAAVGFLLFPNYVGALIGNGGQQEITADMQQTVFTIEGMTCEGCAATVAQAVRRVPKVLAVEVDYMKAQAIVGTVRGTEIPVSQVLAAINDAGYSGAITGAVQPVRDGSNGVNADGHANTESATEAVFRIDGISCEGCAIALSESLRNVPGVTSVRVDYESGRVYIQNPACCTLPEDVVLSTIEKAGFRGRVENLQKPVNTTISSQ